MKTASEVAKYYFDLSNQRQLDAIKDLFHPEASYSSDNTGLYYGKENIMHMMREFFSHFPKLNWEIKSLTELDNKIVEIHFTLQAEKSDGTSLERSGIERIIVDQGLIRHIEVRNIL